MGKLSLKEKMVESSMNQLSERVSSGGKGKLGK